MNSVKIRSNYIMNAYLKEIGYDFRATSVQLPEHFETEIHKTIASLKERFPLGKITEIINGELGKNQLDYFFDLSPIPDYFDYFKAQEIKIIEYLGLGLEILKRLALQLKEHFPNDEFCLFMEFSNVQEDVVYPGLEACGVFGYKTWDTDYDYFTKMSEWYVDKDYSIGILEIKT